MLFVFRVDNLFIFRVGYNNVDGLDPSQGYLNGAMAKGIFRKVYKAFIDPDTPTCIEDCSYDAILCCAGFFQVGINSDAPLP